MPRGKKVGEGVSVAMSRNSEKGKSQRTSGERGIIARGAIIGKRRDSSLVRTEIIFDETFFLAKP